MILTARFIPTANGLGLLQDIVHLVKHGGSFDAAYTPLALDRSTLATEGGTYLPADAAYSAGVARFRLQTQTVALVAGTYDINPTCIVGPAANWATTAVNTSAEAAANTTRSRTTLTDFHPTGNNLGLMAATNVCVIGFGPDSMYIGRADVSGATTAGTSVGYGSTAMMYLGQPVTSRADGVTGANGVAFSTRSNYSWQSSHPWVVKDLRFLSDGLGVPALAQGGAILTPSTMSDGLCRGPDGIVIADSCEVDFLMPGGALAGGRAVVNALPSGQVAGGALLMFAGNRPLGDRYYTADETWMVVANQPPYDNSALALQRSLAFKVQ